jgi:hypothetical protein
MNIDGLQELTVNRSTRSTKHDTTRYATHSNALFPPLVTPRPREGVVVPRSLEHRTRAPRSAVIPMVEDAEIIPRGE